MDSVVINGVNIGTDSGSSYTFNNINQSNSLYVYFSYVKNIGINYIDELDSIGRSVNYPSTGRYTIMRDLDFRDTSHYSDLKIDSASHISGSGWNPIDFNGYMDGGNHSIKNVYLNRASSINYSLGTLNFNTNSANSYLGFFKHIGVGDTVKDLRLENISYTSPGYTTSGANFGTGGGFVGWNEGVVINSFVAGSIDMPFLPGGFVGLNTGKIVNSVAKIQFTSSNYFSNFSQTSNYAGASAGGFCMVNKGGIISNSIALPIFTTTNIRDTAIGSFVGQNGINNSTTTITNSYALQNRYPFVWIDNASSVIESSYTNNTSFISPNRVILGMLNNSGSVGLNLTNLNVFGNNNRYVLVSGLYPILYKQDSNIIIDSQVWALNIIKSGLYANQVPNSTVYYDLRTNKSMRILSPNGGIIDSVFVGGQLYTKDSIKGVTIQNIDYRLPVKITYSVYRKSDTVLNLQGIGSNGLIRISFNPPNNTGGSAIQYYQITEVNTGLNVTTTSTNYEHSGLIAGVLYNYQVKAYNGLYSDAATLRISTNRDKVILSTSVKNGQIDTGGYISTVNRLRVTYSKNCGYYLDSIYVNGVYDSLASKDSINGYTFENVNSNISLKVVYSPYTIQVQKTGFGVINSIYKNGILDSIELIPDGSNYLSLVSINGISIDTGNIAKVNGRFKLAIIYGINKCLDTSYVYNISFERIKYRVVSILTTGGNISVSKGYDSYVFG